MGGGSSRIDAELATPPISQSKPIPWLPLPKYGKLTTMLSIDGGWIRGLVPAVVLERLEEKLQKIDDNKDARIADYFDVITGTSTGGLIATMLVTPNDDKRPKFTAKEIKQFYFDNGPQIFPRRDGLLGTVSYWARALMGPRFDGVYLHKQIKDRTEKHTIAETVTNLVMPTFDVNRLRPVIFSSFKDQKKIKPHAAPYLSDICIGTSAAPTFFPPHFFKSFHLDNTPRSVYHLIDGGLVANNPTMVAITMVTGEVLLGNPAFHPEVNYNNFLVVSIGTGHVLPKKKVKVGTSSDRSPAGTSPAQRPASASSMVVRRPDKSQSLEEDGSATKWEWERAYTAQDCAKWSGICWLFNGHHPPLIDMYSQASDWLVDVNVFTLLYGDKHHRGKNYLRIQALPPLFEDPVLSMDTATEKSMKNLIRIGDKLLANKKISVDLYIGRYLDPETDKHLGMHKPKVSETTNDHELQRFAELLSAECKLRLENEQKKPFLAKFLSPFHYITKAFTSSPPAPLTISGAADEAVATTTTTTTSSAAHSQMPANEEEVNTQSKGSTESQEMETAVALEHDEYSFPDFVLF